MPDREENAWENYQTIYADHYKAMLCLARKILQNTMCAEDVVQDIFVTLLQKEKSLYDKSQKELKNFLLLSVRNKCYDIWRRKQIESRVCTQYLYHTENAWDADPLSIVVGRETIDSIYHAVAQMPATYAKTYRLYLRQFTPAEIAQELKTPVKTIYARLSVCKSRIRALLQKE